ncbi:hypothetical protein ACFVTX_10180 [Agromyces sp. NPDC058136]|uniref:hypothetical protein n=1 Tax=Agromyces sp. NPDC058136 TaxID=3346354 RepID=UPI0036D813BE
MTLDAHAHHAGAPGSGWRSWLWMLLGFLPVALGFTLAARQFIPSSVRSPEELALVGFGWPLVWTVQDHTTATSPASYPTEIRYVGDGRGSAVEVPPTETDWGFFLIDSLLLWAMIAVVVISAVITLHRLRGDRSAETAPVITRAES